MGRLDDCNYRNHANTIQSLGDMFGLVSLSHLVVLGCFCDIQNRPIRNHRILAVAFSRTSERDSKKIFMATNNCCNRIRIVRIITYNDNLKI